MRVDHAIGNGGADGILLWWREAGVDTLIDEAPRDWLAPPAALPSPQAPQPQAAMPATREAVIQRLLDPAMLPGLPARRIAPAGDPMAPLMILTDLPDPEDEAAGRLLAGEPGILFDRMLAAIGLARAGVHLAPLLPARPPAGLVDQSLADAALPLVRQLIALTRPRLVLAMGDAASRAVIGTVVARARGKLHDINLEGASIQALAMVHPRMLMQRASLKAGAWTDLRMAMKVLAA